MRIELIFLNPALATATTIIYSVSSTAERMLCCWRQQRRNSWSHLSLFSSVEEWSIHWRSCKEDSWASLHIFGMRPTFHHLPLCNPWRKLRYLMGAVREDFIELIRRMFLRQRDKPFILETLSEEGNHILDQPQPHSHFLPVAVTTQFSHFAFSGISSNLS